MLIFILINSILIIDATLPSLTKFQIELKTPGNSSETTYSNLHKSVHIKSELSNLRDQGTIVGFEPILQTHFKGILQLSVSLCYSSIPEQIWFDDRTHCYGLSNSMLIYQWNPSSTLTTPSLSFPFDHGFIVNRSISIVFSVTYRREKHFRKEQTTMILTLISKTVKFPLETITVGSSERITRFSCRSIDSPRLLFAITKFTNEEKPIWWRVYVVRVRQFGRKLAELVSQLSNPNKTVSNHFELLSTDLFLIKGDYLVIECENVPQAHCLFLIYYTYKISSRKIEHFCTKNDFPELFKILPSVVEQTNVEKTSSFLAEADGWTIFLLILAVLFFIWISIIIGCIIMRRIRGLVNFRTMPSSLSPSERNKFLASALRSTYFGYGQRSGDADNIMQMDNDQGATMF